MAGLIGDGLLAFQLTPIFGAVLICWIFSVCVHEFAHALVAYLGGDTSVRDKGYLSFDPFAYVHPVTSILIPLVFLALGGIPLPGGAVYIDTWRLRSRHWAAAVSAAGPASNFVLFLLLALVLHPTVGLADPDAATQPTWVSLVGTLAVLQLFSVFFNLIPVPPLDGYGILEPYLNPHARDQMRSMGWFSLIGVYFLFRVKAFHMTFYRLVNGVMTAVGLPFELTWKQFELVFFGSG